MKLLVGLMILLTALEGMSREVRIKIQRDLTASKPINLHKELRKKNIRVRKFQLISVKVVARGRGRLVLKQSGVQLETARIRQNQNATLEPREDVNFRDGRITIETGRRAELFVKRLVVEIKRRQRPQCESTRPKWVRTSETRNRPGEACQWGGDRYEVQAKEIQMVCRNGRDVETGKKRWVTVQTVDQCRPRPVRKCPAQTIQLCVLPSSNNGVFAGRCGPQAWGGSCRFKCTNGRWQRIVYSCREQDETP